MMYLPSGVHTRSPPKVSSKVNCRAAPPADGMTQVSPIGPLLHWKKRSASRRVKKPACGWPTLLVWTPGRPPLFADHCRRPWPSKSGHPSRTEVVAQSGIRYALGVTNSRTGQLTVNGVSRSITFNPTGSWTTWAVMVVNVNLAPGSGNTFIFQSTGQDLANIDQIQIP
jgi:hypothetical protein